MLLLGRLGLSRLALYGHRYIDHCLTYNNDQVYGHEKVSVIDGGLPRARKEGVKLEIGPPNTFKVSWHATLGGLAKHEFSKETEYTIPTLDDQAVVRTYLLSGIKTLEQD